MCFDKFASNNGSRHEKILQYWSLPFCSECEGTLHSAAAAAWVSKHLNSSSLEVTRCECFDNAQQVGKNDKWRPSEDRASVTRHLVSFFNIWPFKATNFAQWHKVLFKIWPSISYQINSRKIETNFWNFAKVVSFLRTWSHWPVL